MGAVALSPKDEAVLESLRKTLKLPSKSQVIRKALEELKNALTRSRLREEIRRSVQKCGRADEREHGIISSAAVHLLEKE